MGSGSSPLGAGFEVCLFAQRSPLSGIESWPALELSDWSLAAGFEGLSLVLAGPRLGDKELTMEGWGSLLLHAGSPVDQYIALRGG
jgi:hypothetical protein